MKSLPVVIAAAVVVSLYGAGASQRWSGSQLLVSSSLSQETWVRTCTYSGADGLQSVEVNASKTCPSTSIHSLGAANQQARAD